ncbi:hypothetical protein Btru_051555 [Bulinus truncatus]|nr:hypothetical protein Btru_051555 [Bulinus truncatus]
MVGLLDQELQTPSLATETWPGSLTSHNDITKPILPGSTQRCRRRGRPRKKTVPMTEDWREGTVSELDVTGQPRHEGKDTMDESPQQHGMLTCDAQPTLRILRRSCDGCHLEKVRLVSICDRCSQENTPLCRKCELLLGSEQDERYVNIPLHRIEDCISKLQRKALRSDQWTAQHNVDPTNIQNVTSTTTSSSSPSETVSHSETENHVAMEAESLVVQPVDSVSGIPSDSTTSSPSHHTELSGSPSSQTNKFVDENTMTPITDSPTELRSQTYNDSDSPCDSYIDQSEVPSVRFLEAILSGEFDSSTSSSDDSFLQVCNGLSHQCFNAEEGYSSISPSQSYPSTPQQLATGQRSPTHNSLSAVLHELGLLASIDNSEVYSQHLLRGTSLFRQTSCDEGAPSSKDQKSCFTHKDETSRDSNAEEISVLDISFSKKLSTLNSVVQKDPPVFSQNQDIANNFSTKRSPQHSDLTNHNCDELVLSNLMSTFQNVLKKYMTNRFPFFNQRSSGDQTISHNQGDDVINPTADVRPGPDNVNLDGTEGRTNEIAHSQLSDINAIAINQPHLSNQALPTDLHDISQSVCTNSSYIPDGQAVVRDCPINCIPHDQPNLINQKENMQINQTRNDQLYQKTNNDQFSQSSGNRLNQISTEQQCYNKCKQISTGHQCYNHPNINGQTNNQAGTSLPIECSPQVNILLTSIDCDENNQPFSTNSSPTVHDQKLIRHSTVNNIMTFKKNSSENIHSNLSINNQSDMPNSYCTDVPSCTNNQSDMPNSYCTVVPSCTKSQSDMPNSYCTVVPSLANNHITQTKPAFYNPNVIDSSFSNRQAVSLPSFVNDNQINDSSQMVDSANQIHTNCNGFGRCDTFSCQSQFNDTILHNQTVNNQTVNQTVNNQTVNNQTVNNQTVLNNPGISYPISRSQSQNDSTGFNGTAFSKQVDIPAVNVGNNQAQYNVNCPTMFTNPITEFTPDFSNVSTHNQTLLCDSNVGTQSTVNSSFSQSNYEIPSSETQLSFNISSANSQSAFNGFGIFDKSFLNDSTNSSSQVSNHNTDNLPVLEPLAIRSQTCTIHPGVNSQSVFNQPTAFSQPNFNNPIINPSIINDNSLNSNNFLFNNLSTDEQHVLNNNIVGSKCSNINDRPVTGNPTLGDQPSFNRVNVNNQIVSNSFYPNNRSFLNSLPHDNQHFSNNSTVDNQCHFNSPINNNQHVFSNPIVSHQFNVDGINVDSQPVFNKTINGNRCTNISPNLNNQRMFNNPNSFCQPDNNLPIFNNPNSICQPDSNQPIFNNPNSICQLDSNLPIFSNPNSFCQPDNNQPVFNNPNSFCQPDNNQPVFNNPNSFCQPDKNQPVFNNPNSFCQPDSNLPIFSNPNSFCQPDNNQPIFSNSNFICQPDNNLPIFSNPNSFCQPDNNQPIFNNLNSVCQPDNNQSVVNNMHVDCTAVSNNLTFVDQSSFNSPNINRQPSYINPTVMNQPVCNNPTVNSISTFTSPTVNNQSMFTNTPVNNQHFGESTLVGNGCTVNSINFNSHPSFNMPTINCQQISKIQTNKPVVVSSPNVNDQLGLTKVSVDNPTIVSTQGFNKLQSLNISTCNNHSSCTIPNCLNIQNGQCVLNNHNADNQYTTSNLTSGNHKVFNNPAVNNHSFSGQTFVNNQPFPNNHSACSQQFLNRQPLHIHSAFNSSTVNNYPSDDQYHIDQLISHTQNVTHIPTVRSHPNINILTVNNQSSLNSPNIQNNLCSINSTNENNSSVGYPTSNKSHSSGDSQSVFKYPNAGSQSIVDSAADKHFPFDNTNTDEQSSLHRLTLKEHFQKPNFKVDSNFLFSDPSVDNQSFLDNLLLNDTTDSTIIGANTDSSKYETKTSNEQPTDKVDEHKTQSSMINTVGRNDTDCSKNSENELFGSDNLDQSMMTFCNDSYAEEQFLFTSSTPRDQPAIQLTCSSHQVIEENTALKEETLLASSFLDDLLENEQIDGNNHSSIKRNLYDELNLNDDHISSDGRRGKELDIQSTDEHANDFYDSLFVSDQGHLEQYCDDLSTQNRDNLNTYIGNDISSSSPDSLSETSSVNSVEPENLTAHGGETSTYTSGGGLDPVALAFSLSSPLSDEVGSSDNEITTQPDEYESSHFCDSQIQCDFSFDWLMTNIERSTTTDKPTENDSPENNPISITSVLTDLLTRPAANQYLKASDLGRFLRESNEFLQGHNLQDKILQSVSGSTEPHILRQKLLQQIPEFFRLLMNPLDAMDSQYGGVPSTLRQLSSFVEEWKLQCMSSLRDRYEKLLADWRDCSLAGLKEQCDKLIIQGSRDRLAARLDKLLVDCISSALDPSSPKVTLKRKPADLTRFIVQNVFCENGTNWQPPTDSLENQSRLLVDGRTQTRFTVNSTQSILVGNGSPSSLVEKCAQSNLLDNCVNLSCVENGAQSSLVENAVRSNLVGSDVQLSTVELETVDELDSGKYGSQSILVENGTIIRTTQASRNDDSGYTSDGDVSGDIRPNYGCHDNNSPDVIDKSIVDKDEDVDSGSECSSQVKTDTAVKKQNNVNESTKYRGSPCKPSRICTDEGLIPIINEESPVNEDEQQNNVDTKSAEQATDVGLNSTDVDRPIIEDDVQNICTNQNRNTETELCTLRGDGQIPSVSDVDRSKVKEPNEETDLNGPNDENRPDVEMDMEVLYSRLDLGQDSSVTEVMTVFGSNMKAYSEELKSLLDDIDPNEDKTITLKASMGNENTNHEIVQGLYRHCMIDCSRSVENLYRDCSRSVENLYRDCSRSVENLYDVTMLDPNICVVCGEHSDQVSLHYARPLCNGCRAFFKRSVQGKVKFTECKSGKKCKVSYDSRKSCKSCRWDACVRAGVDITKVQPSKENDQNNQNNTCNDSYQQTHRLFGGGFEMPFPSPVVTPTLVLPPAMPTTYPPLQPNLSHRLGALGQSPYDISLIDGRNLTITSLDRGQFIDPYRNIHLPYSVGNPLVSASSGSTPSWMWLAHPSSSLTGQQMSSLYNSLSSPFIPYNHFMYPTDVTRHTPVVYPEQRTSTPNSPRIESHSVSSHIRDTTTPSSHSKQQVASAPFAYSEQQITHRDFSTSPHTDNGIHNVEGDTEISMNNSKDVSLDHTEEVSLDNIKSPCQSADNISRVTSEVLNTDSFNRTESESIHQDCIKLTNDKFPETITGELIKCNQIVQLSNNARAFMIDELLRDTGTVGETSSRLDSLDIHSSTSESRGSMITGLSWMYSDRAAMAPLSSASNPQTPDHVTYSEHEVSELRESPIKYDASTFFNLDVRMTSMTSAQSLSVEIPSSPVDPLTVQSLTRLTSVHSNAEDTGSPEFLVDCENVSDEEQSDHIQARPIARDNDISDRLISMDNNDTTERLSFESNDKLDQNNTGGYIYRSITADVTSSHRHIIDCQGREVAPQGQLLPYDSGVGTSASEYIVNNSSSSDVSQNKENILTQPTLHKKRPFIDSALGGETASPKRQKISSQSNIQDVRIGPGFTSTPISKMSREHR